MENVTLLPDGSFEAIALSSLLSPVTGILYDKESLKKAVEAFKVRLPTLGEFDLPDERKGQSFQEVTSINITNSSHLIKDVVFVEENETIKLIGTVTTGERGQWLRDVIDGKREADGYGFGLRGLGRRDSVSFKITDIISFDFVKQR